MKITELALIGATTISINASAVTFNQPDEKFIAAAATIGMTGENWETPEYIASAMPHVYKFSHSYTLRKGNYVLKLASSRMIEPSVCNRPGNRVAPKATSNKMAGVITRK